MVRETRVQSQVESYQQLYIVSNFILSLCCIALDYIYINIILYAYILFILFTNPSARAGYDTRSIFKRSFAGLNSEFSFS